MTVESQIHQGFVHRLVTQCAAHKA